VTEADKLFEFLVKEGRIKLPEGHYMLRPDGVKDKKYCGFHDRNSHSINAGSLEKGSRNPSKKVI
jgi:hypothetical protein